MITERKALEINVETWEHRINTWEERKKKKGKLTRKQQNAYKEDLRILERFKHKLRVLDILEG